MVVVLWPKFMNAIILVFVFFKNAISHIKKLAFTNSIHYTRTFNLKLFNKT